jgi:hypothetical protein
VAEQFGATSGVEAETSHSFTDATLRSTSERDAESLVNKFVVCTTLMKFEVVSGCAVGPAGVGTVGV